MKLFKLLTMILLSNLLLAACGTGNQTEPIEENDTVKKLQVDENKPYIGFAMDTLQDERWYRDKDYFESTIQELGGNVKTLAANGIQSVQNEQVKLLIQEGIDVLVIIPTDATEASEAVALAKDANIPVISYDKLVMNADLDYYISFDNVRVGELQATAILEAAPTGKYAYVGGADSDNNAHLFREGAMNILQPEIDAGNIELVFDQFTDGWSPEVAESNMKTLLETTDVDAVVAANDGTAGGVIRALGETLVPISGQDAERDALQRIIDGTQTMTVYKSLESIASTSAEVAIDLANGQSIETTQSINNNQTDVSAILLDPIAVNAANLEATVISDGHIAKEDLNFN